ncbi:MAG: hypothetical protein CM15mP116_08600 [Synechococcus sp.]|nr:MAG: hypothetical protein CM15mP116_08600 [Synechococcus sp.]
MGLSTRSRRDSALLSHYQTATGNPEEVQLRTAVAPSTPTDRRNPRRRSRSTTDLLRLYLQDIGRVDLLTNEEEVTLARLVQRRRLCSAATDLASSDAAIGDCTASRNCSVGSQSAQPLAHQTGMGPGCRPDPGGTATADRSRLRAWAREANLEARELKTALRNGRRAKDHMIQANLAWWWLLPRSISNAAWSCWIWCRRAPSAGTGGGEIRPDAGLPLQHLCLLVDPPGDDAGHCHQSRTIRLPVHVTEKLNRIKRAQQEIATNEGRIASIADLAKR